MSIKCAYIDFEYNNSQAKKLNLVCCSMFLSDTKETVSYWLHNDSNKQNELREKLLELNFDNYIFVAHYVAAEAHAFISLDLDPLNFKWIDTRTEFRCVLNHSDLMYGRHLIKGKVVYTKRPDFFESATVNNSKPEANLASMVFKMLNVKIDTVHKDEMRDLIISAPATFDQEEEEAIIEYCESDVLYLQGCLDNMCKEYKRLFESNSKDNNKTILDEMLLRGQFGADTAKMYSLGYPIDYDSVVNFSESVEDILSDIARDINKQFPELYAGKHLKYTKPFRYDVKDARFKMNTNVIKGWIEESEYSSKWLQTEKMGPSLSLDAFEKFFQFSHNYPRNNFGAQILRYLKTKQSMNGFRASLDKKKSFWDSVGPDKRVRPFLNPYGAATSRSQPSATGFIPLKAAWMRSLIIPPKGRAMVELDYGSQEYLVAALLSKDKKMVDSYKSGDVYLYFAKEAGLVPKDATKASHPIERQAAKSAVLAISYSMTGKGLARTLSQQSGVDWEEEDAQKLIDDFHKIYKDYAKWKDDQLSSYNINGYLKLKDGWYLWGDNPNKRSVGNFPIQGAASDILRRACNLAHKRNIDVTYLLHDAAYAEYDSGNFKIIDDLEQCLRDAFVYYFDEDVKDLADSIRIDGTTWSLDYTEGSVLTPKGFKIPTEHIHVDERTVDAYEKFSPYFKRNKVWDKL